MFTPSCEFLKNVFISQYSDPAGWHQYMLYFMIKYLYDDYIGFKNESYCYSQSQWSSKT